MVACHVIRDTFIEAVAELTAAAFLFLRSQSVPLFLLSGITGFCPVPHLLKISIFHIGCKIIDFL